MKTSRLVTLATLIGVAVSFLIFYFFQIERAVCVWVAIAAIAAVVFLIFGYYGNVTYTNEVESQEEKD